jgi:hypothetical protein
MIVELSDSPEDEKQLVGYSHPTDASWRSASHVIEDKDESEDSNGEADEP